MAFRRVVKDFAATRANSPILSDLEGYDTTGDEQILAGGFVNDNDTADDSVVNGELLVRFTYGQSAFCARRSVFDNSTEKCNQAAEQTTFP